MTTVTFTLYTLYTMNTLNTDEINFIHSLPFDSPFFNDILFQLIDTYHIDLNEILLSI